MNRIIVDESAMLNNVALIAQLHPQWAIIPVLKSNAYGHGLKETAEILNQASCDLVAVDGYYEAARIRYVSKHPLLVLGYSDPTNARLLDTKHCAFVIQDKQGLEAFGRLHRAVNIHIELDTGMNRLGLHAEELDSYLEMFARYPNLHLDGIMTHLADADNATSDDFTKRQSDSFDRLVNSIKSRGFSPRYIHIAQTAGSTKIPSKTANAMRLGIGLYGINPLASSDTHYKSLQGLWPVLSLRSTIIKTMSLQAGDTVGYNRTYTAQEPMRVGVLPLGYYEGVPRSLANRGFVTWNDSKLPIIGKVCMNHTMIDLKDSGLEVGDEVTVLSSDPTAVNAIANISNEFGLLSYEVLAKLSGNIRRQVI